MARKLVLTGFMATGKSAIGAIVARRLGWPLVDSDREIEIRAGKAIVTIFAEDGEPSFRALEREVIAELAARQRPMVIATGGGALVDERNFTELSRSGVIICLAARPDVIAARVAGSGVKRPKLLESNLPVEDRIRELLAARSAAYARAAATVDTSELSRDQVAEQVLAAFADHGGPRCGASA
jgi:shikimate kinase